MESKVDMKSMREAASQMPSTEKLNELTDLVKKLAIAAASQTEFEQKAKEQAVIVSRLESESIPALMSSLSLEKITLSNGMQVSVVSVYSASVPEIRKADAWQWLKDHNFGALIKSAISITLGRDQVEEQKRVTDVLSSAKIPFIKKEEVHPQTLKAFVKERYEAGESFPEALFGAFTKPIAQVKLTK